MWAAEALRHLDIRTPHFLVVEHLTSDYANTEYTHHRDRKRNIVAILGSIDIRQRTWRVMQEFLRLGD